MTAGLECYSYLGGPCGESPGGHVHEDWAVVQAVDPETGLDVPDGEWGDLVVTTLDRDNGLLRYDLEEAAMLVRDPCPCGETTIRGFWGGRFKDLLLCQGKRFFVPTGERAPSRRRRHQAVARVPGRQANRRRRAPAAPGRARRRGRRQGRVGLRARRGP